MRDELLNLYDNLFDKYNFEKPLNSNIVNSVICNALGKFIKDVKNPAIYCYGEHTMMLMTDFVFYLKKVKIIIDNYCSLEANKGSGFKIIRDHEIEDYDIDSIIISSYKFKDSIKESIKKNHKNIKILDLYEEFEKAGINLQYDYYRYGHPFHYYKTLNSLQNEYYNNSDNCDRENIIVKIITEYIKIKNFEMAYKWAVELVSGYSHKWTPLLDDLRNIIEMTKFGYKKINRNNVLMLCLDGFRRQDFSEELVPKMYKQISTEWINFENAYSYSTSTLESLIPVYSQNTNQKTNYSKDNTIKENNCKFIAKAIQQGRVIHFYTDIEKFVDSDKIHRTNRFQTITEKMWDFLLDGVDVEKGLFYVHSLYESHYSFANPYTKGKMIAEGTALLFDYLPQKGGKIRTNYIAQQKDAIKYIDDVVAPILECLNCNIVLFADHGNLLLEEKTVLHDIEKTKLVANEELIRIPLAIKTVEKTQKTVKGIYSLLDLNRIIVNLMDRRLIKEKNNEYIKIGRTELYNPDFRLLYESIGCKKYLLAFEGFIFERGYKLLVFSNGVIELYNLDDQEIFDEELKEHLLSTVKNEITIF
ncbi:MAG: sulfatase-like hydrolase/transferase [Lachnospiraceae bacterium]